MVTPHDILVDTAFAEAGVDVSLLLHGWAELWDANEVLACRIAVNRRLTRSLGLCKPDRNRIDINPLLLRPANRQLLEETLCHELAHLVIHRRLGRRARPHGREWSILMRAAGHRPRAGVPGTEISGTIPQRQRTRYEYDHHCIRCDASMVARRTSHRWRCARCVAAGYSGDLEVTRRRV